MLGAMTASVAIYELVALLSSKWLELYHVGEQKMLGFLFLAIDCA